jgi:hypothetical protein
VILGSAAEDPQGLDNGLFEFSEPDKFDPEPDGTTVHPYSVPHFALEPDVLGGAPLGSLDRHVASDPLRTSRVKEQNPDTEFGDVENAALSRFFDPVAVDSAVHHPAGDLAWYSTTELHD